ncbi:DUF2478 domain-containing protein [Bradyrhizobium huanghuaihaiense]|uniref:DUF2478 domain-containing protein n=1 Tax=Bradyrhizobium huanghuaihaiense TaxID=990078 RepID=UPI003CC61AA7
MAQQGLAWTASCSDTRGAQMSRTSCSQSTLRRDKRSRFPATRQRSYVRHLDRDGLAKAAAVVSQALRNKIDLLMINRFAKQEAARGGLRTEFVDAITRGVPVLTAFRRNCLADWGTLRGRWHAAAL